MRFIFKIHHQHQSYHSLCWFLYHFDDINKYFKLA